MRGWDHRQRQRTGEQRGLSSDAGRVPSGRTEPRRRGHAVSPGVALADVEGVSPEAGGGGGPCSLPGPEQSRGGPACRRYSGHCLHTMYGWLQGEHTGLNSGSKTAARRGLGCGMGWGVHGAADPCFSLSPLLSLKSHELFFKITKTPTATSQPETVAILH